MSLKSLTSEHEVILRKFTITQGATGAQIRSPADVETLLCRVQTLNSRKRFQLGQNGITASHVLYFGDPEEIAKLWEACNNKLTDDYHFQFTDRLDNVRFFTVAGEYDTDELGRLQVINVQESKDIDRN